MSPETKSELGTQIFFSQSESQIPMALDDTPPLVYDFYNPPADAVDFIIDAYSFERPSPLYPLDSPDILKIKEGVQEKYAALVLDGSILAVPYLIRSYGVDMRIGEIGIESSHTRDPYVSPVLRVNFQVQVIDVENQKQLIWPEKRWEVPGLCIALSRQLEEAITGPEMVNVMRQILKPITETGWPGEDDKLTLFRGSEFHIAPLGDYDLWGHIGGQLFQQLNGRWPSGKFHNVEVAYNLPENL